MSHVQEMTKMKKHHLLLILILFAIACSPPNSNNQGTSLTTQEADSSDMKVEVILDTDANNELDDQHAMAYLFFSSDKFEVVGITVNATSDGEVISKHFEEADRVMRLCNVRDKYPLLTGANSNFEDILPHLQNDNYDGKDGVEFIISEARKPRPSKLVVLAIGKLTNVALALAKAPDISQKIKIVWLGTNYPLKGEYNMVEDIPSMNYVFKQEVPLELVTVRYTNNTGSNGVGVTAQWIFDNMPGAGPTSDPVTGRHGGEFTNFGDYSVDLFKNIRELFGDPPSRALFDVVAVAILKNPNWGQPKEIPCPVYSDEGWKEQPENSRKITVWEYFDRDAIVEDFIGSLKKSSEN